MRILLVALLLVGSVSAQMGGHDAFSDSHQLRVGYETIPTSINATNLDALVGEWKFEQSQDADGEATFFLPVGHVIGATYCGEGAANAVHNAQTNAVTVTCNGTATLQHAVGGGPDTFGARLLFDASTHVFLYAPTADLVASAEPETTLPGATFDGTIYDFGEVGATFWFNLQPAGALGVPEEEDGPLDDVLPILLGIVAGMLLWSVLVSRGIVQKRTRKQVAGTAAHKQVAATENKARLEGRKRLLMAGLKDLEMAKMNKEIDTEDYDALKADFKKQAVTVMRALEEAS